jgi:hypothetical protein
MVVSLRLTRCTKAAARSVKWTQRRWRCSPSVDEDITSMDATILVTSCPKVNQLYIKIKFDTFEQLMLHYDFVAFSFSELLDWIKPCVEII